MKIITHKYKVYNFNDWDSYDTIILLVCLIMVVIWALVTIGG